MLDNDIRTIQDFENEFASVKNIRIYGLDNALRTSGYPMQVDINSESLNDFSKNLKRGINLGSVDIGTGHDNYLKGIIVQFDLTLSQTAWCQLQRYHFIDFVSSCSKMHRLTRMNIEECCNPYVDQEILEHLKMLVNDYNRQPTEEKFKHILYNTPLGFKLTSGMTTNYQQLKTIYKQRRNHRLNEEWGLVCDMIEALPLFTTLTQKMDR